MSVLEEVTRVAFGRFEVDLQSGEVWKGSLRIRMPAQPFKLLVALLERPGEVISKEDHEKRLWGTETNVDFERAIAGAINKVREALNDSAEDPKYVETLPKRGYRFVASVTILSRSPAAALKTLDDTHSLPSSSAASLTNPVVGVTATPPLPQVLPAASPVTSPPIRTDRAKHYREVALSLFILGQVVLLAWNILLRQPFSISQIDQLTRNNPVSEGPPNQENLPTLATNGTSIFATALVDGKPQLAAISIGTGDIQRVPLPQELASVAIADTSRDGSRLLLLSRINSATGQSFWVVPTTGGRAFRVGNVLAHAATWMPDQASILYAFGDDLSIVQLSDGNSVHLASLSGRAFWPRWSPDGKTLRFTLMIPMTHSSTLWEMAAGANKPKPLAKLGSAHGQVCCGVWTADGSSYVFQMYRERERGSDLWELRRSFGASRPERLTQGPMQYYFSPIAARSGRQIFFLGSDNSFGLQRFDPVEHKFVLEQPFLRNATRVEYSPDGASVIWTDSDGGLWRASAADGSDRLQLAPPQYEVFAAHWSPDGNRLALMARAPGHPWSIYLENATGGELTSLLDENHNAADPTWSPDGKQLVFGREPDLMGKEPGPRQIYRLDLQTRKAEVLPDSDGLFSPRWSPDGRWIAALSLDQTRVMLFDTQARSWRLLAESSAADPVWSRDSKALYVHAFLADEQPMLRLNVLPGKQQIVADLANIRSKKAENYFFSGLTPDNQPLILPRVGTSNLYSLNLSH